MVPLHRKPLSALLLVVGVVLGVVLGLASPGNAHAELLKTTPATGASLDQSPPSLVLDFGESVRIPKGGIRLINESSTRIATPSPTESNGGRAQTVSLPTLPKGAYVVSWRAVSADGHPIRGAFTFRVGGTGDQAAVARLAEKLLGAGGGPAGLGITLAVLRFCAFLSMIILIGGLGYSRFVRVSPGSGLDDSRSVALTRAAAVLCALSGLALVLLYGPYVGGYGFGAVTDGTLLDDTLNDSVGQAIIARTVALVLLGVVLTQVFRSNAGSSAKTADRPASSPALTVGAAVFAAAALVAQVFAGHGNTGPQRVLGGLFTIVHVGSTALWIGGLVFVVAVAIRPSNGDATSGYADLVLRRFSPVAFAAVIGMVVSGVFASWRQVGSIQAARETTYGQLLLVKLALVAALLALGGLARRRLQTTAGHEAVSSVVSNVAPPVDANLRRRLFLEVAIGVVVVGVTALLVNVAPAREVVAKPVALRLQTTTMNIDITIDPAKSGVNAIHIYALTKTGAQQTIDHASLSATHGSGIEPLELKVLRAGPNHFQVLNADLPLKGVWTLEITVGKDQFTEEQASAQITLR